MAGIEEVLLIVETYIISVNVQAIDEPIEYKYVVIDAQTQTVAKAWS